MPYFNRILSSLLTGLVGICLCWGNAFAAEDEEDMEDMEDDEVVVASPYRLAKLASLQQPPAADPSTSIPSRPGRTSSRSTYARLARAPNMFGDSQLLIRFLQNPGTETPLLASFASNSVGSRKIAENDKVMPMDRVFFGYNEFHGMVPPLASTFNSPLNPPASASSAA